MPTLPPPHEAREIAESFGVDPERYDRTRPRYPDALLARILDASPGPAVLDVGTGTGIVARWLRDAGASVLGVEPDPRMAAFARSEGFDVEVSTFEAWDPAGREVDAVVAGQSWHWVDPVAGAVAAARVLRSGGRLAVFWTVDEPPAELDAAITEVYRRVLPDSPFTAMRSRRSADPYAQMRETAADGMRRAGLAEPEQWRVDGRRTYTRDAWLDMLPTQGAHTRLPADTLDRLLAGISDAVDAAGGTVEARAVTTAVTATVG